MPRNVEEILPGFYKLTLPVPVPKLKSVFAYLVKDGNESLLIDTGWGGDASYHALVSAFESLDLKLAKLNQIIISHLHPDHFGLSSRLKKEVPGAKLLIHAYDATAIKRNREQLEKLLKELRRWLIRNGAPKQKLISIISSSERFLGDHYPAIPNKRLHGGEKLRVGKFEFLVIHTPGHTRGTICLYEKSEKILFSGDHVLPTITPNISLSPLYSGNPLGDYLNSIRSLRKLGHVSMVLPSHEFLFRNLQQRLLEIERHHGQRLAECVSALRPDKNIKASGDHSVYEVASKLKWYSGSWSKLTPWEMRAAMMETAAHLEYLKKNGKISRRVSSAKIFYLLN
ncbi:MAG: MBL fold metallo-hydrolase [Thaumarchaeota archaeon]|nr:MBL fold metallo-hydrolase [Nitrososphaerota archaeon]